MKIKYIICVCFILTVAMLFSIYGCNNDKCDAVCIDAETSVNIVTNNKLKCSPKEFAIEEEYESYIVTETIIDVYKIDIICELIDVIEISSDFANIVVKDFIDHTYTVHIVMDGEDFDTNHYQYYKISGIEFVSPNDEHIIEAFISNINCLDELQATIMANDFYELNLPVG